MDQVKLYAETEINPTESKVRVKTAICNVFGDVSIAVKTERKISVMTIEALGQDSLARFRNLLRTDRIRDAARKTLFHSIRGNTVSFCLNKQVAYAGHISFSEETAESPLGPIRVTITSDNPRLLIEWLAEKSA